MSSLHISTTFPLKEGTIVENAKENYGPQLLMCGL